MPFQLLKEGMDWRFGNTTHDSVNTGQAAIRELDGVYRIDPGVADIGAAIQDIHDTQLSATGECIFIPPGTYTQSTPITLEKWCTITSPGGYFDYPAVINKQGDFDALTLLIPPGEGRSNGGYDINGIHFNGTPAAGASRGVVVRSIINANFKTSGHGSHGTHFTTPNDRLEIDNTNYSQGSIVSASNGGSGVRIDSGANTTKNLNAMDIWVRSVANSGFGFDCFEGYSNRFHLDCENNGGRGIRIADGPNKVATSYVENNGGLSIANGNNVEVWTSTNPARWDKSAFGTDSVLVFGGKYVSNNVPLEDTRYVYADDDFQTVVNNFGGHGKRFFVEQGGKYAGSVTISSNMRIETLMGQRYHGHTHVNGGISTAVTIDGSDAEWVGLSAVTDAGSGANGFHVPSTANNVMIERVDLRGADGTGIVVDGNECVISKCRGGSVVLNGNDNYVVASAGTTVTDNGLGNTVV